MQLPPDLQVARATLTVSTTVTVDTLLAAPGAGFRYRLWAWGVNLDHAAAATLGLECFIRVASGPLYDSLALLGPSVDRAYYPGGFAWTTNTAVSIQHDATAAGTARAFAYYTLESMA